MAAFATKQSKRDPRVDFLRGLALLTIFVDHVPGNFLGMLTLRNFGFSDAAELFVILAGFSASYAYGRTFEQDGATVGLKRVAMRCARIYFFQVGMLLTTLIIVDRWTKHFGMHPVSLAPLINGGISEIEKGLSLKALPSSLNILPLYIVLLAAFPLIYLLARRSAVLALSLSGCLWIVVNLDHDINLTNSLDGKGWFFNPFAWQFLFTIGVVGARFIARNGGALPRVRWLAVASWVYLGFALLAAAPWSNWGLMPPLFLMDAPDKTALAPLRLLHVLALIYLALSSSWFRRLVQHRAFHVVEVCGKHSLEVFSLGTMIALFARLSFKTFGTTIAAQILVNGVGFAAMIALALMLERSKMRARTAALPAPMAATS